MRSPEAGMAESPEEYHNLTEPAPAEQLEAPAQKFDEWGDSHGVVISVERVPVSDPVISFVLHTAQG